MKEEEIQENENETSWGQQKPADNPKWNLCRRRLR
jgi:hypothetical protein